MWECKSYREYGKNPENGCDNIRIPEPEMNQIVKRVIFNFWKNKGESIYRILKVLDMVLKKMILN